MREKRIVGTVQTQTRKDAGRVVFQVHDGRGGIAYCRSGPGYPSITPNVGQRVALVGEFIKYGPGWIDFRYSDLQLLNAARS